jgi:hypothetical protein
MEKKINAYKILVGKEDATGDLGLWQKILLKWIIKYNVWSAGWIQPVQDTFQWRDLVNTFKDYWVPWKAGNLLTIRATYQLLKKDSVPWSQSVSQ